MVASTTRASSHTPSYRRVETNDSDKAGRVWAREPDEDPWAPCILTLDGGGIRGYSSLLILKELMHHIWLCEARLDYEEQVARQQNAEDTVEGEETNVPRQTGTSDEKTESRSRANSTGTGIGDASLGVRRPVITAESAAETLSTDIPAGTIDSKCSRRRWNRQALSEDELLPCHYFDFMYGTSTGGLIATIIGRLRMSVTDGLELYRSVGDILFGKRRSSLPFTTKYHHEPLERAVRELVADRCTVHPGYCDGNDLYPWDMYHSSSPSDPFDVDAPSVCQSCCLTATNDEHIFEAHLLRSYPHYYSADSPNWITPYNQGADMLPIWQVTRATTAAPFYFEMVKATVNDAQMSFKDGGIRENNPSGAALSEFHALYEGKLDQPCVMLSIGTGMPDQTRDGFAGAHGPVARIPLINKLPFISKFLEKRAVIQNLLIKYTEGEHQHLQMREHAHGEHTWYKRLNVSDGLQNMALDDWVKGEWQGQSNVPGGASLTRMEDATETYLNRDFDPAVDSYAPPAVMLRQTAEKLVRQRRAREKLGGERWEVFLGRDLDKGPATTRQTHKNSQGDRTDPSM